MNFQETTKVANNSVILRQTINVPKNKKKKMYKIKKDKKLTLLTQ